MRLEDKINETIETIKSHYDIKIVESDITCECLDKRELEFELLKGTNKVTEEDLHEILKDITGVNYHIIIYSNIGAILVEICEPHIA
jgi:hypothetical protein